MGNSNTTENRTDTFKKFLTLLLIPLIFALSEHGFADANPQGESLTGAFGFKFSENYSNKEYNYIPLYQIKPKIKSPFFSTYYLTTTPLSGEIINIMGLSGAYTLEECRTSAENVTGIIKGKYRRQEPYNEPITSPIFASYKKGAFFTVNRGFFGYSEKIHSSNKRVDVACVVGFMRATAKNSKCEKIKSPYSAELLRKRGISYADTAYLSYLPYTSNFLQYYYLSGNKYWIASEWTFSPSAAKKCYSPMEKDYRLLIRYRDIAGEKRALTELERKRVLDMHENDQNKGL